jgi:hypothetical protein
MFQTKARSFQKTAPTTAKKESHTHEHQTTAHCASTAFYIYYNTEQATAVAVVDGGWLLRLLFSLDSCCLLVVASINSSHPYQRGYSCSLACYIACLFVSI